MPFHSWFKPLLYNFLAEMRHIRLQLCHHKVDSASSTVHRESLYCLDNMAHPITCLGHKEREDRRSKICKIALKSIEIPHETWRVMIKKGPMSMETSLKELEEEYESKPEWKLIKEGGVLSIPVEELRMENPPKPDHSGQVTFKGKREGGGKKRAIP